MVFISNFCHMLLNLNSLFSLSCSVTVSVTHVGPATGWGEGEKSRSAGLAASPSRPGFCTEKGMDHLMGHASSSPCPPSIKAMGRTVGQSGLAFGFKFQSLCRGHRTRTSLSSVINTTVTGALKSQSQESVGTLPASPHC